MTRSLSYKPPGDKGAVLLGAHTNASLLAIRRIHCIVSCGTDCCKYLTLTFVICADSLDS